MEHKLITAGEQYLPFARSRIKALRAAGLKYASQQFEIDGCSVKVRIEGEHEYITLSGGSDVLQMDSGVIDVGVTNEEDPARYLPAVLIKSGNVAAYDAMFTREGKAPWWLNPDKTSAGQLSGEISGGRRIAGKVRKDGVAKSFAPKNTMQGTPPVKTPDHADEALVAKKRASDLCPPSMFTGRARLYAQALLGQYLYAEKMVDGEEQSNAPPILVESAPPSLLLSTYQDKDAERVAAFKAKDAAAKAAAIAAGYGLIYPDPYSVTLNINSGVYLDPVSGKHWLLNPTVGKVMVYPLKSSQAGESLRKWLKPAVSDKLSAEDRDHLEAYILSACRPHVELAQTLAIGAVNPYAMGYGWHWNWSGTRADMVQCLADDEPIVGCVSSTHHRLTVTAAYDPEARLTNWSANTSVIEGPVVWSTVRPICCITEPTWGNRQTLPGGSPIHWSMKTTSVLSPLFECDAPFYAFYKKDELQVCRSKAKKIPAEKPTLEFSKGYAIRLHPDDPDNLDYSLEYVTLGANEGYFKKSSGYTEHWELELTSGASTVNTTYGKFKYLDWTETKDKTPNGFPLPAVGSAGPYVGRYEYGDPLADGSYAYVDRYGYQSYAVFSGYSFNVSSRAEVYSHPGVAGAIIPFYDAEAVYLMQNTSDELLKNHRDTEVQGASFHQYNTWGDLPPSTAVQQYVKNFANRGTSSGVRTLLPDEITVSNKIEVTRMAHRAGGTTSAAVTSDAMGLFADPEDDYVAAEFKTLTSASFSNPVIRGMTPGGLPLGMPDVTVNRPAIIGWA